jgi:hypothetical protein
MVKKIQITETFPNTLEEYYMLLHDIIKDLRAMLYLVEVATVVMVQQYIKDIH